MNELPVYEYRGITYIRMSDMSDEGESARLEAWMEGRWRLSVPKLEYQDAVCLWQYARWELLSDPDEQAARLAALENIDVSDYTPEEIEAAKQVAALGWPDISWQLYLPRIRKLSSKNQSARVIAAKLATAKILGIEIEFTPEEAAEAGAFQETALSEQDALP